MCRVVVRRYAKNAMSLHLLCRFRVQIDPADWPAAGKLFSSEK